VQHSTGGYLLLTILTMKWVFDYKPRTSSGARPTWLGHRAQLLHLRAARRRATEIMFEGVPVYPDAGRFWKMIQDTR